MSQGQVLETLAKINAQAAAADEARPIAQVAGRIANRHRNLAWFWSKASGWAPGGTAEMLAKARLDQLAALAVSLRRWVELPAPLSDGGLILAWANLGALVDGLLKLHLTVYLRDYKADVATGQASGSYHFKKEVMLDPEGLRFDVLIAFHEKRKLLSGDQVKFLRLVQQRRNIIHAFKDADLGTTAEFLAAVRSYRGLLKAVSSRLPYPDVEFEPSERGPH